MARSPILGKLQISATQWPKCNCRSLNERKYLLYRATCWPVDNRKLRHIYSSGRGRGLWALISNCVCVRLMNESPIITFLQASPGPHRLRREITAVISTELLPCVEPLLVWGGSLVGWTQYLALKKKEKKLCQYVEVPVDLELFSKNFCPCYLLTVARL